VLSCGVQIAEKPASIFRHHVLLCASDTGRWHLSVVHLKMRDLSPAISYAYKLVSRKSFPLICMQNNRGVYPPIPPQQASLTAGGEPAIKSGCYFLNRSRSTTPGTIPEIRVRALLEARSNNGYGLCSEPAQYSGTGSLGAHSIQTEEACR
jgi:hypothetical protein